MDCLHRKYCPDLKAFQRSSQTGKRRLQLVPRPLFWIRKVRVGNSRLDRPGVYHRIQIRWNSGRTHSRGNTPSLHKGPSKDRCSKIGAVAFGGFHSSILVIIVAILLIDTRASSPLTTPRQLASPPPSPSGRKSDSWKRSCLTTGPRTSSISLSGSKRRARSWRNWSMSEEVRVSGDDVGVERRGAERAERDRRGPTSSGGPRGRLRIYCHSDHVNHDGAKRTLLAEETSLAPEA